MWDCGILVPMGLGLAFTSWSFTVMQGHRPALSLCCSRAWDPHGICKRQASSARDALYRRWFFLAPLPMLPGTPLRLCLVSSHAPVPSSDTLLSRRRPAVPPLLPTLLVSPSVTPGGTAYFSQAPQGGGSALPTFLSPQRPSCCLQPMAHLSRVG